VTQSERAKQRTETGAADAATDGLSRGDWVVVEISENFERQK
jgi:hypothetical protein